MRMNKFYTESPKWSPLFSWMPIETLVHHNQSLYYKAQQDSHTDGLDCRPFIDFMLDAIVNSLYKYIDHCGGEGQDVGVKEQILSYLKKEPALSAKELATLLNKTSRTVERYLKELREQGRMKRVGSDKTGYWEVTDK